MSFNIALSGLAVSQKYLNTTANNIANSNTTGFKQSRAEFADVYAQSVFGAGNTKVGDGASTSVVAQQFSQGGINSTNNSLDLAIEGNGFFATTPDLDARNMTYTRAGNFKLNEDNFVVTNTGNYLQVYPVNQDGTSQGVSLSTTDPLQIPNSAGSPVATEIVNMDFNVESSVNALDPNLFNPNDNTTFHASSAVTTFDSLGEAHILTSYFVKDSTAAAGVNRWYVFTSMDTDANGNPVPVDLSGAPVGPSVLTAHPQVTASPTGYPAGDGDFTGVALVFDATGNVVTINGNEPGNHAKPFIQSQPLGVGAFPSGTGAGVLSNGADGNQTIELDYGTITQQADSFRVDRLEQDGATVGRLNGVNINDDGLVTAEYDNGTITQLGRVAIVRFANEQGLQQIGNASWVETINSGEPLAGEANSGTFGTISSSALEASNVDITQELVDLIVAQKSFQANSRALDVNSQLQQTILGIR